MKIKVLKSVAGTCDKGIGYNYGKGFEGEVPSDIAQALLKAGQAIPVPDDDFKRSNKRTGPRKRRK